RRENSVPTHRRGISHIHRPTRFAVERFPVTNSFSWQRFRLILQCERFGIPVARPINLVMPRRCLRFARYGIPAIFPHGVIPAGFATYLIVYGDPSRPGFIPLV